MSFSHTEMANARTLTVWAVVPNFSAAEQLLRDLDDEGWASDPELLSRDDVSEFIWAVEEASAGRLRPWGVWPFRRRDFMGSAPAYLEAARMGESVVCVDVPD